MTYRTGPGKAGSEGDYNIYDKEEQVEVGEKSVVLKSNDDIYQSAVWEDDSMSYSVRSENGIEKDELTKTVDSVDSASKQPQLKKNLSQIKRLNYQKILNQIKQIPITKRLIYQE